MPRFFRLLGMKILQVVKFLLILAIIGGIGFGIYWGWVKFIKKTQKHTQQGKSNYASRIEAKP